MRKVNVLCFPVLLLLMQLLLTALGATNQTLTANVASNNGPNSTNTTGNSTAPTTTTTVDANPRVTPTKLEAVAKQLQLEGKVNRTEDQTPVLARGVTKTDTATVQESKSGNTTATATQAPPAPPPPPSIKSTNATIATNPTPKSDKILANGVTLGDINSNSNDTQPAIGVNATATSSNNSSSSSSTTTTTTSTTTTTTTTTTTPRPKKPKVTSSMAKQLEGEKLDAAAAAGAGAGSVAPHVLPVQEMSSMANRDENEYIVPIVSVMLAVPLAIAVFIIMYRRFRDLWSTRHYRRMDFLVDGMYND